MDPNITYVLAEGKQQRAYNLLECSIHQMENITESRIIKHEIIYFTN
jgi:hypothetical protein